MIKVYFVYKRVDGYWCHGEKCFHDLSKAFRFIQKCKYDKRMGLDSYTADDMDEYEWLCERC